MEIERVVLALGSGCFTDGGGCGGGGGDSC